MGGVSKGGVSGGEVSGDGVSGVECQGLECQGGRSGGGRVSAEEGQTSDEGRSTQCAPTRVVQARSSDASLLRPVSTERSQVKGTVKGDAGATASLSSVRQVSVPESTNNEIMAVDFLPRWFELRK